MSGTGRRSGQAFIGEHHFDVVPSDTVNFVDVDNRQVDAAVVVWGAGNVVAVAISGAVVTWPVTVIPFTIPVRLRRVNATGTTATLMKGVV